MRLLIAILSVLAFCAACESTPTVSYEMYSLSTADYKTAISLGCQRGQKIALGPGLVSPRPMGAFGKGRTYALDALYYMCEEEAPKKAFDTNDKAFNQKITTRDACKFYMYAYLIVVKGYSGMRGRVTSRMLCEYDQL